MIYHLRSSSLFLFVGLLVNNLLVDVGAQTNVTGNFTGNFEPENVAFTDGETDETAMNSLLTTAPVTALPAMNSSTTTVAPIDAATKEQNLRPVPVIKSTCYDNTREIFDISADDRLLYKTKKFMLCPNTVYDIGQFTFNETFTGITGGQYPLVPRMNTVIQCGESGEASNNCTLRGGSWGLITVPLLNELDFDTSDVLIKGLTFVEQDTFALFFGLPGTNFVVDDCVVKNQLNEGPIVFNNRGPWQMRRNLRKYDKYEDPMAKIYHYMKDLEDGSLDDEMDEHRELQGGIETLHVTIQNSLIENNTQSEMGVNLEFGVITFRVDSHNVTIKNNLFVDNHYGDEMKSSIGYALLNVGSAVNLIDNCFVDNQFFGSGMIVMNPNSVFQHSGNYATCSTREKLTCPFIVSFETEEAENLNVYDCYDSADSDCSYYKVIGDDRCNVDRDGSMSDMSSESDDEAKERRDGSMSDMSSESEDEAKESSGFSMFSRYVVLPTILLVINMNL